MGNVGVGIPGVSAVLTVAPLFLSFPFLVNAGPVTALQTPFPGSTPSLSLRGAH